MNKIIPLALIALASCADYNASHYQPAGYVPPDMDRRAAFDECNHLAWGHWADHPHLAMALGIFGAAGGATGALIDQASTGDAMSDEMARCMASHGYSK